MVNLRVWKLAVVGVVLSLLAAEARAGDEKQPDRDRKARAALALAAAAKVPAPTAAPTPRVGVKDYAAGHAASLLDQRPLVVFVGCDVQRCEGAHCAKVDGDSFGHVKGPAIVVGYPQGQKLFIETTLPFPAAPAELKRAVDAAARKIDPPAKRMPPAPAPDSWRIQAVPRYYYPPVCRT